MPPFLYIRADAPGPGICVSGVCAPGKEEDMRNIALFDLDGTLTDPKEGITRSVAHALAAYGIQVKNLDELCPFIGPPLSDSFQEFYGFSPDKAREAIRYFHEYFTEKGMFENRVYRGIPQMLRTIREAGIIPAVATSKPELFAEKILYHFDLRKYFELVGGADMDETRVKKGDVIAYTLDRLRVDRERDRIVMIGDRKHDIIGAHENGLPCAAVLYGYGSRGEFDAAGADVQIETVEDLTKYLLSWKEAGKNAGAEPDEKDT